MQSQMAASWGRLSAGLWCGSCVSWVCSSVGGSFAALRRAGGRRTWLLGWRLRTRSVLGVNDGEDGVVSRFCRLDEGGAVPAGTAAAHDCRPLRKARNSSEEARPLKTDCGECLMCSVHVWMHSVLT